MAVESYTGVHGVMLIDSTPVADVTFSVKVARGTAEAKRSGKWSSKSFPGSVAVTGSIDEILIDGKLLGMVIGETEIGGTAVTLHAGLDAPGAGLESVTDMTTPSCTTASKVKATVASAVTGAGYAVLFGTGPNGAVKSEVLTIGVMNAGGSVTSVGKFLTVTHVTLTDIVSTGTIAIASVAGGATIVVGKAKEFDLVGKVEDGVNNVTVTAGNCFLTAGELSFADADTIVRNPATFAMKDPDEDLDLSYD